MSIKRSVSLYSLQNSYYYGNIDLEGCIKFVTQELKAPGIELIYEQMPVGAYPNPTASEVSRWKDWMQQYGATPTCMDSFLDWRLYKNRVLTLREQVEQMANDLRLASRLGFPCIRVLCPVRAEVIEASIPYAEEYGVQMGLEIHAPMHFEADWAKRYLDMAHRTGSPMVKIIPDFGIFQYRPSQIACDNAIKAGAKPEIIDFIVKAIEADSTCAKDLAPQIQAMGGGPAEIGFAMQHARLHYSDPSVLRDIKDLICHVHAKFYDMDDSGNETCIRYPEAIQMLKDIGWEGYLSSEFEGQDFYEGADVTDTAYELEQLKRHHRMMAKLLGE